MQAPPLVLASASPARRQLLQMAGFDPLVQTSNFDESQVQLIDPVELVQVLAQRKAETVANQLQAPALVLGCDSVLQVAGEIHGKPADPKQAIRRWQLLRGRSGDLYTGHALIDQVQDKIQVRCQQTRVHFAEISDRQIQAYVETGEPLQCAGGFALDGRGGLFVKGIEGCPSNVIGLSLPLFRQMLVDMGYEPSQFWR